MAKFDGLMMIYSAQLFVIIRTRLNHSITISDKNRHKVKNFTAS